MLWFVGRQPNFLLCHGLNMHPALIVSCYYLIGNELLEKNGTAEGIELFREVVPAVVASLPTGTCVTGSTSSKPA